MENLTSPSGVSAVSALEEPIVRNLLITQSYHEISVLLTRRIGSVANWCTFATWASKQAGQTIRHEDLRHALTEALNEDLSAAIADIANAAWLKGSQLGKQRITQLVWETIDPKATVDRAAEAVARGNRKVYAEIAMEFARFLVVFEADEICDEEKIAQFCQSLRPGDPPDGQGYLRQAFARYYEAFFEMDACAKAQLILLANLEIGFHEQTRLQPEIAEALEAAIEDPHLIKAKLMAAFFPNQTWVSSLGNWLKALTNRPTPLDQAIQDLHQRLRFRIRKFLTEKLMTLGFPQGQLLHLGRDLPAHFPENLRELSHPALLNLLQKVDPTKNDLRETGAKDWADLAERLHFIADLFRCYQETAVLLTPPFNLEQTTAIKQGKRPAGQL